MNRPYLAGWVFVALAAGCSSPSKQGKSTGTNWLVCRDDADCPRVEGATCRRDHVCVDQEEKPIPASVVDGSGGASPGGQGDSPPTGDAEPPAAAGSCLLEYNDALASGDPCCYRQGGTNTCNTSIMCNDRSGAGCCLIYGTDSTTGGSRCCLYDAGELGDDDCRALLAQSR
jgi:hypothetical protein